MSLLEFAEVTRRCAGECAFLMTEQFRFDQLGGHCGTVQRDERTGAARALLMERACHQFFACARFT